MYPSEELSRLSRRKALLRRRITRHRTECAARAGEVARPFAWIGEKVSSLSAAAAWFRRTVLPLFSPQAGPGKGWGAAVGHWLPAGLRLVLAFVRRSP